ncbi:class 1 fructose-bisphosphatase [Neomegalonema sp.]|uniref:class 1 fructose-bisphosphatase n=1 Tax=Neomegalonema sp. TaxID=2039713 RepID=UPI002639CADA|nr:class 1 fructose-bisphosphatase [Neomegalonema sp.]MDD2868706.1 class 1 fructose-bisphosphatase [Neomegalonema sp.]
MRDATRILRDSAIPEPFEDLMNRIALVATGLSRRIARGGLDEDLAGARGQNAGGDGQKALDVIADEAFMEALRGSAVRYYASEEQEEAVDLNGAGGLALAIDPLDGSSNIDVNLSIGTIFGVYSAGATARASFLRPGRDLLAAGYVVYGPQCLLVATFGQGVLHFLLDPEDGRFHRLARNFDLSGKFGEFAINASNHRHWPRPIRAYVEDCLAGEEGPRRRNYNMRWVASLVAETHRILTRGGVFLYPGDARKGYERGRLRYLYECAPIAFLIEQAGGAATDGVSPILAQTPDALHARTPFVFGGAANVARIAAYHELSHEETSALFGGRGLFRS